MSVRLSEFFNLNKSQSELDFVDIPLDTDIPLFVDPYAISIVDDPWFIDCNDLVVEYFQLVIDSIRNNQLHVARRLLLNLHEPNDTHLGLSCDLPSGRGIGKDQARYLYGRLKQSKAVATGNIQDLADLELHIPGISNDKISDITINIIREKLVEYTEVQCVNLNIPTKPIGAGPSWSSLKRGWVNRYAKLPSYRGNRILLVPKAAVRFSLTVDHQKYYNDFVLEFLQAEHLKANSALVEMLKNGKRRVTKKSLKEQPEYKISKELLYKFSEMYPEVLQAYRDSLPREAVYPKDEYIEERQNNPKRIDRMSLVERLQKIPRGSDSANLYHSFILGALENIFYPSLRRPVKEQEINEGRKRIDIVFDNGNTKGFFSDLNLMHHIHCPYIMVECKNYSKDLKNPELDQMLGRFTDKRGFFGIVVCREIEDKGAMLQRCKDIVNDRRGYILVLDDADIENLLILRAQDQDEGVHDFLRDRLKQLLM